MGKLRFLPPTLFISEMGLVYALNIPSDIYAILAGVCFASALTVFLARDSVMNTIDSARETYTEEERQQPRIVNRLRQPRLWWLYAIFLFFMSGVGLLGFYVVLPPSLVQLLGLLVSLAFVIGWGYVLLLVVFMAMWESRTVFAVAWTIRVGLRLGSIGALLLMVVILQLSYALLLLDIFGYWASPQYTGLNFLQGLNFLSFMLSFYGAVYILEAILRVYLSANASLEPNPQISTRQTIFGAMIWLLPIFLIVATIVLNLLY